MDEGFSLTGFGVGSGLLGLVVCAMLLSRKSSQPCLKGHLLFTLLSGLSGLALSVASVCLFRLPRTYEVSLTLLCLVDSSLVRPMRLSGLERRLTLSLNCQLHS
jgi:hypothetical protein